jgi:hypothetical protein
MLMMPMYLCITLRNEGVAGFFRGIVPNCLKVAPNAALTFVVYEECLKLMNATHIE